MSKFTTKHENSLLVTVIALVIFVEAFAIAIMLMMLGHALIGTAILIAGAVAGWVIFRGMVGPDYAEFKRDALALIHQGK